MSYLEELLPQFRKGAKIRKNYWNERFYVYFDDGIAYNQDGEVYCFDGDDLTGGFWELYKDQEPDWQYIIDNKCLCWFWDMDETSKIPGHLGRLVSELTKYKVSDSYGTLFMNCCPVRRDEITFYEDRKDD